MNGPWHSAIKLALTALPDHRQVPGGARKWQDQMLRHVQSRIAPAELPRIGRGNTRESRAFLQHPRLHAAMDKLQQRILQPPSWRTYFRMFPVIVRDPWVLIVHHKRHAPTALPPWSEHVNLKNRRGEIHQIVISNGQQTPPSNTQRMQSPKTQIAQTRKPGPAQSQRFHPVNRQTLRQPVLQPAIQRSRYLPRLHRQHFRLPTVVRQKRQQHSDALHVRRIYRWKMR